MSRNRAWRAGVLLSVVAASPSSCALIDHFSITMTGGAGGAAGSTTAETASTATSATSSTQNGSSDSASSTQDASSSGSGGSCSCTNLVSAYRFSDTANLGKDFFGNNDFTSVAGVPTQSTETPPGLTGHSIDLDGSSTVCLNSGFTFDSTSDHTLCWWSRPAVLANQTNQFAQTCSYDTWTQGSGVDYLWRINNCNTGTPADLVVPAVYSVGQWVQICQTYTAATLTRAVTINGDTSQKTTLVDTVPIVEPSNQSWCIGSYGGGGFWTGLIYLPMWFDRVLSDAEIQGVFATACCLP